MTICLHIAHPIDTYVAGLREVVRGFAESSDAQNICPGWKFRIAEYDKKNGIDAKDFCSAVKSTPGPVLLINPIQGPSLAEIRVRLDGRQFVFPASVYDTETLCQAITELKTHHDNGEPLLSIDQVVALLLMRKLDREHMWAGNDKGYMWRDSLPKGRGVDEKFSPRVLDVVNILKQNDVLTSKLSNSIPKYALNPDRRKEIYEILRTRRFSDQLARVFARQPQVVSARELDLLGEYDAPAEN